MSDRIPGSSWSNPIWHGKWRIYVGGELPGENYAYVHDDYDGADVDHDIASRDDRYGYARTVDEAKAAIAEREDEADPAPERTGSPSQAQTAIEQTPNQQPLTTEQTGGVGK